MPLSVILASLRTELSQCDNLIANAHRSDSKAAFLFTEIDRRQITTAAFLNLFIAWETFLESTLAELMVGAATISGCQPIKYVGPLDLPAASRMVVGVQRYFDYGNHDFVIRIVKMYFKDGYPFEPNLSSIKCDLADLHTMRNAAAHITSSTQTALEALAQRIFSTPRPGVDLYTVLTSLDPRSRAGETVLIYYRNKLLVAAEMIVNG